MNFMDNVQKLWIQIDHLHVALMDMEESPLKLDYKRRLEGCMKDYLSSVPLERRFYFPATNNVLYETILKKEEEFNPVRTAQAWDALNTYASNLLTQFWRREFRELRLYCGAFKHQIEGHLIGAVQVLNLLGYRNISGLRLILEGPVDPDRVARVARDCLLAKTECEILRYIWEGVSSKYSISWEEIANFRRDYISTPEQAMRTILYRRREEEYYKKYGPPIHCPSGQTLTMPYPETVTHYPNLAPPFNQYPYPQPIKDISRQHSLPCQSEYLQPAPSHRSVKGRNVPYDQNMNENKYHLLDSTVEDTGIKSPLIPLTVLQMQDDVKTTDEQLSLLSVTERPKKGETTPSTCSLQYSGGNTIWDYVYRDLENQGYSKDLGERGNILDNADGKDASFDEVDSVKQHSRWQNNSELALRRNERMTNRLLQPSSLPKDFDHKESFLNSKVDCSTNRELYINGEEDSGGRNHRVSSRELHTDKFKVGYRDDNRPKLREGALRDAEKSSANRELYLNGKESHDDHLQRMSPQKGQTDMSTFLYKDENRSRQTNDGDDYSSKMNGIRKEESEIEKRLKEDLENFHCSTQNRKYLNTGKPRSSSANAVNEIRRENQLSHMKDVDSDKLRSSSNNASNEKRRENQHSDMKELEPDRHRSSSNNAANEKRRDNPQPDLKEFDPLKPKKWECQFCTYINKALLNVCDMCGKSRNLRPESVPCLVSGGKECWKCTLVNDTDGGICVACGASLVGSPTYI
ncbi:uncharacterized protein LOC136038590 [Artemia franciscana]|uniref:RanBP2-type domain-containing protein n=1 Tax=Artemia franciscana TaxID=6661 RepID=A0AA88L996_ARTSF|nr:hypothetical protein QYM36_006365 [Artemia franciscana]KAK2717553.1 hypothetical protein QYM36_006365 [Artemia franciscana]KAK2717554.1 hypothetical protein QYM36_006365 [Artemia franciscana]